MKFSEVKFLLEHGYTKEEIAAFDAEETPTPAAENVTEPTPAPEKQTDTEADTDKEKDTNNGTPAPTSVQESETEKLLKALGLKVDNAIKAIHSSNINNMEQSGNTQMTTDDVLAQIINPKYKGD